MLSETTEIHYKIEVVDNDEIKCVVDGKEIQLVDCKPIQVGDMIHYRAIPGNKRGKVERIENIPYFTEFYLDNGAVVANFQVLSYEKA